MPKKTKRITDQYDSPWKEAIEEYFAECIAFFFPEIYADIDWTQGYQFLDKELARVVRQGIVTEHYVDKLARVYRLSGDEAWVLLHIDVQSQHETTFDKRLYRYNYRLYDRYDLPIVTLVIYGDDHPKWRPTQFERSLWGCRVTFEFPTVKLLDYNISDLEANDNPFAMVVLAHRHTKATLHDPEQRYRLKWRLTRMLYDRGYSKAQIQSLYRYIDWLMRLPPVLEQKLDVTIEQYEENQKMPYITSMEQRGIAKGIEQGIQQGLEQGLVQGVKQGLEQGEIKSARESLLEILLVRFGDLPPTLTETISSMESLPTLKALFREAITTESLPHFEQRLTEFHAKARRRKENL